MASVFTSALAVKELEPGEWHWVILKEAPATRPNDCSADEEDPLCYVPDTFSDAHADAAAAWAAGYLVIRAAMRRASGRR